MKPSRVRLPLASRWPSAWALALALATAGPLLAQKEQKEPPKEIPPYEVAPINSTSWYGRFGLTNCAWIDMGDGVLVIDTGASVPDGANLAAKIKETTKGKPIKWFVLTHLHADSNSGLKGFLPTDATIFVNARVAPQVAKGVTGQPGAPKVPTVVGVKDHVLIVSGESMVEVGVPEGPAHTDHDLYAYSYQSSALFVGDLVTPGRCPMLSDPGCDPAGWMRALDRLEAFHAAIVVPTRGNSSKLVANELTATRSYVKRVLDLMTDFKKKSLPDARVAGEMALRKLEPYCPIEMDTYNAQAIYRRITPEGKLQTPPGAAKPGAAPKPAAAPAKK